MTEVKKWPDASDERLDIIEANECGHRQWELATQRFRRVFNELHERDAEIERLRGALQAATKP